MLVRGVGGEKNTMRGIHHLHAPKRSVCAASEGGEKNTIAVFRVSAVLSSPPWLFDNLRSAVEAVATGASNMHSGRRSNIWLITAVCAMTGPITSAFITGGAFVVNPSLRCDTLQDM